MMRNSLGVLQNMIDVIAAFFLILGGWNATNSNTLAGYSCVALGPVLPIYHPECGQNRQESSSVDPYSMAPHL